MVRKHPSNALIVVRIRGGINTIPKIKSTLHHLRLNKVNHCVIIHGDVHMMGMLQVVKDYVTWGEVDEATLEKVIKNRGRLTGNRPITNKHVKDVSDFKDIHDLVTAIIKGKAKYRDLKEVKPLFRLHPPIGGLESTKQHFTIGGDLGYRGTSINDLISRMIEKPKPKQKKKAEPRKPIPELKDEKKAKRAAKKRGKKVPKKKVAKKKKEKKD